MAEEEALQVELKLQKETVKRDWHQLNYEKLKALNNRMEMLKNHGTGDTKEKVLEYAEKSKASELLPPRTEIPGTHFGREVVKIVFENEMKQLKNSLEKLGKQHNPALKSREAWAKVVSQWEADYRLLFQEFEDFQSAMATLIRSEIKTAAEKVSAIAQENKSMKIEFEKQKTKWSKTIRELTRDKICNECEIRTLRDQLDESRRNFLEKSNLCEALYREIDHLKTPVPPPRNQEIFDETLTRPQLETQLKAEQSRNSFLEDEIKTLSTSNEELLKEIQDIHEQNHLKVMELSERIRNLEMSIVRDLEDFEVKQESLKEVIRTHESCISEMEHLIRANDEEKQEIMLNARDHVKTFMDDSIKTIKKIETKNLEMTAAQESLNQELAAVKQILNQSKESVKSHQKLTIFLCKQGLAQLSSDNCELTTLSPKSKSTFDVQQDLNNNNEDNDSTEVSVAENVLLVEEAMLKKLIEAVANVKKQFKCQQENLQSRIIELGEILKNSKLQHAEEFGRLQKKCKKYGQLIRKLRTRQLPQFLGNARIDDQFQTTAFPVNRLQHKRQRRKPRLLRRLTAIPSIPMNMKVSNTGRLQILTRLQEKHEHFQNILDNISTCNV